MPTMQELASMLPAKQGTALMKKYNEMPDDQKASFLKKATDVVNKYKAKSDNRDPMVLQQELDAKNKANRDPMILQQELDAKNKKSYVVKPSKIFKPTTKKTDKVEGYMTPVPEQYMTPVPEQNMTKAPEQKPPYLTGPEAIANWKTNAPGPKMTTGPEAIANWKTNAPGPKMTTGPEAIKELFKKWKSIPKYASGKEGFNTIFNR